MIPKKLDVNEEFEIGEWLDVGEKGSVFRILLSPSKCYLNDKEINLEKVIQQIVHRYNCYRPLYQLHWQFPDRTEMVAQAKICSKEQMDDWIKETKENCPLPEGAQWLVCNEASEHFVLAVEKSTNRYEVKGRQKSV